LILVYYQLSAAYTACKVVKTVAEAVAVFICMTMEVRHQQPAGKSPEV